MTGKINRLKFGAMAILAAVLYPGCDQTDHNIHSLGRPTLLAGKESVDVLFSIQREFKALPKPVLAEIVRHERSSRTHFIDFTFTRAKLPDFYQFVLTDSAQAWAKTHTHAEMVAALLPLLLDSAVGPEAAILITGLASNRPFRSEDCGRHVFTVAEGVSKFMVRVGYRSPSEPGASDVDKAHKDFMPHEIWLEYFIPGEKGEFREPDRPEAGTLKEHLARLRFDVRYYENGLMLRYPRDAFVKAATLDEWSDKSAAADTRSG